MDYFKYVNDIHGHLVGDKALISVAKILKENIRETDLAGRWGGEEFMIICSETDVAGAVRVAKKIQAAIGAFNFEQIHTLTCSFGITESHPNDKVENIVARADKALYEAKEEGRNRICTQ